MVMDGMVDDGGGERNGWIYVGFAARSGGFGASLEVKLVVPDAARAFQLQKPGTSDLFKPGPASALSGSPALVWAPARPTSSAGGANSMKLHPLV